MSDFKQAARLPTDGAISIAVLEDGDHLLISCTTDGERHSIRASRHNASRLFATIALALDIPLSAKVGKAIKL